jgi:CheY-like chemotaxis protein
LVQRRSRQLGNALRDAVIPVLGVAPQIPIEPIPHVDQFFGYNHFDGSGLRNVKPGQIDQDEMLRGPRIKRVRAPDRGAHPPPQPTFEYPPLGGDPELISGKVEQPDVMFQMRPRIRVVDLPSHDAQLLRQMSTATRAPLFELFMRGDSIIPRELLRLESSHSGVPMPSALQRPHVLIVSDDSDLTNFLGEGLIYAGFWTSIIASAVQTLEVFRLRSFDIMVLDAALGGIGASELLRRLRGLSSRAAATERTDIPIVVIAASASELDRESVERAGVSRVLVAPLEIEELAEQLFMAVASWRANHPDRPWADEAALGPP